LKKLDLARGKWGRLPPLTHTAAKRLLPVAHRLMLFYGLDNEANAEARIEEDGVVISSENEKTIIEMVRDGSAEPFGRLRICFSRNL